MTAQGELQRELETLPYAVCLTEEQKEKPLINNAAMRALLKTVERESILKAAAESFLQTEDGRIFFLTLHKFFYLGETLLLRSLIDVSDRYSAYASIAKEAEEKVLAGKGIREYNAMIDDVIVQREVLTAKTNIHADMGSVLLATKRLLMKLRLEKRVPSPEEKESLRKQWIQVIGFLKGRERAEEKTDVGAQLMDAAKAAGITLTIRSALPEEQEALRLFVRDAGKKIMECARSGVKELVL